MIVVFRFVLVDDRDGVMIASRRIVPNRLGFWFEDLVRGDLSHLVTDRIDCGRERFSLPGVWSCASAIAAAIAIGQVRQ
jgi:hypothetical protein